MPQRRRIVVALPEAQAVAVRLYRVVTIRGDLLLGLTEPELAALGPGPEAERLARHIVDSGGVVAWRYDSIRSAEGGVRLVAQDRVAVLRQDALLVEAYDTALPVAPPPRP